MNLNKEVFTARDVISIIEEYKKEKEIDNAWSDTSKLYQTQFNQTKSSNMIGYITDVDEDYKYVNKNLPKFPIEKAKYLFFYN